MRATRAGKGRPRPALALIVLAVTALAGCAPAPSRPAFPPEVTGTVSLAELAKLPAGAELRVTLYETSAAQAEPKFVAAQTIHNPGAPPLRFRVAFPPAVIDPRAGYTVVARIEVGGRLEYLSERPAPVLTLGNPARADLVVTPAAGRVPAR